MGEREITPRADVYALGCVLYEMLSGEPPFTGPTAQAIIARVMTEDPRRLTLQRRTIPPHVEAAVETALEKLPADRWASAAEFGAALQDERAQPHSRTAAQKKRTAFPPSRLPALWAAAVGVAGVVLGAAAVWFGRDQAPPAPAIRFYITGDSLRSIDENFALSPDGTTLVYRGRTPTGPMLFVQRLSELEPRPIPGTEDAVKDPGSIFFAPDGATIGYHDGHAIKRVRLDGTDAATVVQIDNFVGATWAADGSIIYGEFKADGLYRVEAQGGTPTPIPVHGPGGAMLLIGPHLLPGGRSLLCVNFTGRRMIGVLTLATGRFRPLVAGLSPRYLASGHLIYGTGGGSVMIQPFDASQGDTTGPAVRVADGVATWFDAVSGFDAAGSGVMVTMRSKTRDATLQLARRDGRSQALSTGRVWVPRFSPDGRRIAYGAYRTDTSSYSDLWTFDLVLGNDQRLTAGGTEGRDYNDPAWSPDGSRLAMSAIDSAASRDGATTGIAFEGKNIYLMPADGSGPPVRLLDRPGDQWPTDWTRDGKAILFTDVPRNGTRTVWLVPISGAIEPRPVVQTPFNASAARLSADGRWLAYSLDETGRPEIYIQPFPGPGRRSRVSRDGGQMPVWSRRGTTLYYWSGGQLLEVALQTGAELRIGAARTVMRANLPIGGVLAQFDIHPDGERFAVSAVAATLDKLAVVSNVREALVR